ncbi:MAG: hypothetical protein ACRENL_05495, partial [Candidatus Dormibacteria bacterium]
CGGVDRSRRQLSRGDALGAEWQYGRSAEDAVAIVLRSRCRRWWQTAREGGANPGGATATRAATAAS